MNKIYLSMGMLLAPHALDKQSLDSIYVSIKTDKYLKEVCDHIYYNLTDYEQTLCKIKYLNTFTPYGIFRNRNNAEIEIVSSIIFLDFDPIECPIPNTPEEIARLKEINQIEELLYKHYGDSIIVSFLSARRGLKVGLVSNLTTKNNNAYNTAYTRFYDEVKKLIEINGFNKHNKIDINNKGLSHPQFLSYDPNIKYNPQARALKLNLESIPDIDAGPIEIASIPQVRIKVNGQKSINTTDDLGYFKHLVNEILYFFKSSDCSKEVGLNKFLDMLFLSTSLINTFDESDAKPMIEQLYQITGNYVAGKFEERWQRIMNVINKYNLPLEIGYFLRFASQNGFIFAHKDVTGFMRIQPQSN